MVQADAQPVEQSPLGDPQEESRRFRPPMEPASPDAAGETIEGMGNGHNHRTHHHRSHGHSPHNRPTGAEPPSKTNSLAAASQLLQFDDQAPMRLALVVGVLLLVIAILLCCKVYRSRRKKKRRDDIAYQPLSIKNFESAQISDLDSEEEKVIEFRRDSRHRK